ncbi:DMT family transporter [Candidatus Woesearchaeota archaeon]|nr:DMT family transporter [Candidatus Woesearchaeota archaeon]
MPAGIFALASAVSFAISNVVLRKALLRKSSAFNAFVAFAAATAILWLIVLLGRFEMPNAEGFVYFALRGLLDPGIAPLLIFFAFSRIGVSITAPILAASSLVSTAIAVLFLSEPYTYLVAVGTLLVVAGVAVLAFRQGNKLFRLKYVLVACLASVLVGAAAILTKLALQADSAPFSGLAISLTAGILLQSAIITSFRKWNALAFRINDVKLFAAAGIFIVTGFSGWYLATEQGLVSVIFPIISSQALFTILLSYIFLRKHETITKNVVIGAVMVVAGIAVLSVV